MKYWLYITSYIYRLLMLVFIFIAVNMSILLYVGDIGTHGSTPEPRDIFDTAKLLGESLIMVLMSGLCYFAGRQMLYPQIIVNIGLLFVLFQINAFS